MESREQGWEKMSGPKLCKERKVTDRTISGMEEENLLSPKLIPVLDLEV